jgi:hypothetical protein
MPAFATVEQFAAFMQTNSVNEGAAELLLAAATTQIQLATGQHFFLVEDDTITIRGDAGRIYLPQMPVVSVASVTSRWLGDPTETPRLLDMDYVRWGNELNWSAGGYARINASPKWGSGLYGYAWPEYVTVTYTHGYAEIPADVVVACMQLAAEVYSSPDGIGYESIDDYAWRRTESGTTPAAYALKMVTARYGQRARMVGVR